MLLLESCCFCLHRGILLALSDIIRLLGLATRQACVGQMPALAWYRNQGKFVGRVCLAHTRRCHRDNAVAFCFNHLGHVGLISGNHDPACRWTSHDANKPSGLLWKLSWHSRGWNRKMMLQIFALLRKKFLFCKLATSLRLQFCQRSIHDGVTEDGLKIWLLLSCKDVSQINHSFFKNSPSQSLCYSCRILRVHKAKPPRLQRMLFSRMQKHTRIHQLPC